MAPGGLNRAMSLSGLFTNIGTQLPQDCADSMDVSLSELRELVMDRVAWCAVIQGVVKSRTRLSD